MKKIKDNDLYWIAGLLEGEGSFSKAIPSRSNLPCISVQMTDEDVISRIADIFGNKYHEYHPESFKKKGWKCVYSTRISGRPAIRLMKELKPLMSIRRQGQIDEAIQSYTQKLRPWEKLKDNQKIEVFNLKGSGLSAKEVAKKFNISHWRVYQIWRGEFKVI